MLPPFAAELIHSPAWRDERDFLLLTDLSPESGNRAAVSAHDDRVK